MGLLLMADSCAKPITVVARGLRESEDARVVLLKRG
jgi:hypothetical protein